MASISDNWNTTLGCEEVTMSDEKAFVQAMLDAYEQFKQMAEQMAALWRQLEPWLHQQVARYDALDESQRAQLPAETATLIEGFRQTLRQVGTPLP
jgi:chromatin segregation and condensation protein Rec8/ScpA/Scc1 (kleisin family)